MVTEGSRHRSKGLGVKNLRALSLGLGVGLALRMKSLGVRAQGFGHATCESKVCRESSGGIL